MSYSINLQYHFTYIMMFQCWIHLCTRITSWCGLFTFTTNWLWDWLIAELHSCGIVFWGFFYLANSPVLVFVLMLFFNEHCNNCSVYIFKVKILLYQGIVIMIIMLLKRVRHEGNDWMLYLAYGTAFPSPPIYYMSCCVVGGIRVCTYCGKVAMTALQTEPTGNMHVERDDLGNSTEIEQPSHQIWGSKGRLYSDVTSTR